MKNQFIKSIFTCLIIIMQCTTAMGGDATSYDPTSVSVQAKGASDTPIGSVIAWPYNTIPEGWLECNGQSTSAYPDLAAVVGSKVPDLRGEFIRGWDHGRGVDRGRRLKSSQSDQFKSHNHNTGWGENPSISAPYGSRGSGRYGCGSADSDNTMWNTSSAGGSETRPRNVSMMYIIKAQ